MNSDPQVLSFARITPALWEELVPQALQDRFILARYRAMLRRREVCLLADAARHFGVRPQAGTGTPIFLLPQAD